MKLSAPWCKFLGKYFIFENLQNKYAILRYFTNIVSVDNTVLDLTQDPANIKKSDILVLKTNGFIAFRIYRRPHRSQ